MTRSRTKILLVIAAGVLGILFWLFYPSPSYDLSRVEPRLRALQAPYQNMKALYYLDGGSVGIEIVDQFGTREQFSFPVFLGGTNNYSKVYVGTLHVSKPGAVLVSDSEQTKRMLIAILADLPTRSVEEDVCLTVLRRRPTDYLRCMMNKWSGRF